MPTCPTCRGRRRIRTYPAFGGPQHFGPCPTCHGSGRTPSGEYVPESDDGDGCGKGALFSLVALAVGLAGLARLAAGIAHAVT